MSNKKIPQITIGADYFRTTVRKESCYPLAWRWTKEVLQNSCDAEATKIIINMYENDKSMEIIDNGIGMDEDTLLDVFLSFGGTKKNVSEDGEKPIGGFGDAKKIICFCWDRWEIHTLDNYLNNELMGVEVQTIDEIDGTRIRVWMGEEYDTNEVIKYLNLCQLNVNIEVNIIEKDNKVNLIHIDKLKRNKLINDFGFGKLYVNKSKPTEKLIVRINGLALFTELIDGVKATCVLELESAVDPKSKDYMLNVTREQLTWKYRSQVHAIIMDMLSNPVKALKPKKEEKISIMKGVGACTCIIDDADDDIATNKDNTVVVSVNVSDYISSENGLLNKYKNKTLDILVPTEYRNKVDDFVKDMTENELLNIIISSNIKNDGKNEMSMNMMSCQTLVDIISSEKDGLQSVYPYDIIIKGNTKKRYDGVKYKKFILAWHKIIQYVCFYNTWNDNKIDLGNYNIGFIFDEDVLAQRCVLDGVPCYLLNPSDLNFQEYSWRGVILQLVDRAIHEITHHFVNEHNGNFIATYNGIKKYAYIYIEDIFYEVGKIIRSNQKDLVDNANLNEEFVFSE